MFLPLDCKHWGGSPQCLAWRQSVHQGNYCGREKGHLWGSWLRRILKAGEAKHCVSRCLIDWTKLGREQTLQQDGFRLVFKKKATLQTYKSGLTKEL